MNNVPVAGNCSCTSGHLGDLIKPHYVTESFPKLLKANGLRHIRYHDLRHSAATNMHELTGDFYTVGQILGHSLKGIGIQLGISNNLESVTAQYVDVRLDRKTFVLNAYHQKLLDLNSVISIE